MEQINYISIWNKFFREGRRSCFGCVQTIPFVFFFFSEEVRTNKLYTHEKLFGDMEQMFFVCLERTSVCLEHSLLEI
jgi:hypothetical protein